MNDFRNNDTVLITGVVVSVTQDEVKVSIKGVTATFPTSEVSLLKRSFHEGDSVSVDGSAATILQTVEDGVHLVKHRDRTGVSAYEIVEEVALSHRMEDAAPAAEHGREARDPDQELGTDVDDGSAGPETEADAEKAGGAEGEKREDAPVADRTDDGRAPADLLAGALDGSSDGGADLDIDIESIGETQDYRPVGERAETSAQ